MWWRIAHFAAGLVGAFLGYVAWVIAASQEGFAFYTIRSAVTVQKAMADICHHPADDWVWRGLFVTFYTVGATAGLLAFGLFRRMLTRRPT